MASIEKYFQQLISDINYAKENVSWPFVESKLEIWDWISNEDEEKTAPIRDLEDWTGIHQEMLPPEKMLNDEQLKCLLEELKKLLDAYNWSFVMQIAVPERIQYETIRQNFKQPAKLKRWNMGFFEVCKPGTEHKKCALGEYCQCAFFKELFSHFIDEELTPEEERARHLEMEIEYIKRKYEDDWMKYYPYHLDPEYDDEYGNPCDYGFGDDEDDDDDWWRK